MIRSNKKKGEEKNSYLLIHEINAMQLTIWFCEGRDLII